LSDPATGFSRFDIPLLALAFVDAAGWSERVKESCLLTLLLERKNFIYNKHNDYYSTLLTDPSAWKDGRARTLLLSPAGAQGLFGDHSPPDGLTLSLELSLHGKKHVLLSAREQSSLSSYTEALKYRPFVLHETSHLSLTLLPGSNHRVELPALMIETLKALLTTPVVAASPSAKRAKLAQDGGSGKTNTQQKKQEQKGQFSHLIHCRPLSVQGLSSSPSLFHSIMDLHRTQLLAPAWCRGSRGRRERGGGWREAEWREPSEGGEERGGGRREGEWQGRARGEEQQKAEEENEEESEN
jgi:hypothetical protein